MHVEVPSFVNELAGNAYGAIAENIGSIAVFVVLLAVILVGIEWIFKLINLAKFKEPGRVSAQFINERDKLAYFHSMWNNGDSFDPDDFEEFKSLQDKYDWHTRS